MRVSFVVLQDLSIATTPSMLKPQLFVENIEHRSFESMVAFEYVG